MRPGVRVGVDVGSVRVGVAMSDPDGLLATPVASLPASDGAGGDGGDGDGGGGPIEALHALVQEHRAVEVIVGLPRGLSGAEGASAQAARAFAVKLSRRVRPVPVRLFDERLSTVEAHRVLRASGRPGRRQREVVDQVAAVTILQTALDLERASGRLPGEVVGGRKPRHAKGVKGAPR